ncbi:DMT family transporter [Marivibrio halodurans]
MAVAAIVAVAAALSLGDAVIKGLSVTLGLWQLVLLRAMIMLAILGIIASLGPGIGALWPARPLWAGLRGAVLVAMWMAYYAALPHLSLAAAAAGYYTLPFFILAFSALFARERLTRRAILAALVGFLGVLLVLRPGAAGFTSAALLPILAAVLYALAMNLTRTRCRDDNPLSLSLTLALAFVVAGTLACGLGALLPDGLLPDGITGDGALSTTWRPVGLEEIAILFFLAVILVIASVGTAFAYQNAPGGVVGACDYSYVGFAVIWGLAFHGEHPDILTLLGLALIAGAGIASLGGPRRGKAPSKPSRVL